MRDSRRLVPALLCALAVAAALRPHTFAQPAAVDPALYGGLRWRAIGPFRGGRVDAVSGVPGRPHEFYFGSVNGGVWKTINAGRTWFPVFDAQPIASIGALAVAPSSPDTVYVGSGESTLRDSVGYGNGVYKSIDAGRTWTHLGLDATQHIGKVAVDPRNAQIVFVAAIGHFYAAHPERGVYRSKDGGRTWQKVLYKNDSTGAVDVVIDPANSQVVYASLWNTRRPPWYAYAPSNGPGGGIYKSVDSGTTWKQLTAGLPGEGVGRSGVAIAASNPRIVYAVIDAKEGGLFRSNDAGATWTKATADTRVWGRGWYFEKVAVDPKNPEIVYVPNVGIQRSTDGGKTFGTWAYRGSPGGDDYHQVWINPADPGILIAASDQGAIVTLNAGAETPQWSSWINQPTAQIYHVSADYRFPYWVTGAQQDSGAVAVRTRGKFGEISTRDWEPICAGGESGYTAADPLRPGVLFGGSVSRCDLDLNGEGATLAPPAGPEPPRRDWTQPLVFSKADPHALYYADQYVYKMMTTGGGWTRISDDLTRPDPGVPPNLDEAAAAITDRNGKRGVVYTIAPSPLLVPMLWAGTDDGLIHVTTNDGKTWQNVTPAAMTPWSRVTMIEASHRDVNEAYASVDRHQLEDFEPYIYRTRDGGRTWQKITNGLASGVYVHTVKEDPKRPGLLFAGTERAAYVSFNDGDTWQSLQLNLPTTSMRDLEIHGDDLIVATHGRGFWVLDDISVLRQIDVGGRVSGGDQSETRPPAVILFNPADAVEVIAGGDNGTPLQKDEPQAENPPSGAVIDYYVKSAASGPVTIEILNAAAQTLRTYSSDDRPQANQSGQTVTSLWMRTPEPLSAAAGLHRWVWDFRPAPPVAAGRGRGGRGGAGGGGFGRGGGAPMAPPGAYSVKLTVNGRSYTQPLTVLADPRSR